MDLALVEKLGLDPAPGATPAGDSIRYDPDFEAISAEIEKLTAVEQAPVDWRRVVELGMGLLKKGKDLLVGSYVAVGLLQREGYGGLAAGCVMLQNMVGTFWDNLFPELRRLRARIAAFDWLAARLEKVLATKGDPGLRDAEALDRAIAALQAIADDRAHFGDEPPNLAPAVRALRSKRAAIPEPEQPKPAEPAPAAKTEAPAERPAPPPPPPPPPPKAADPAAVVAALGGLREKQIEYAAVLRTADPADPRAYQLLRETLWSDFALPTARDDGRLPTKIGDPAQLATWRTLLDTGEFLPVLAEAEALAAAHPLWLDLQKLLVEACDAGGRRQARARNAMLVALAHLLRRRPELAEAIDQNGKPLAGPETRIWLGNEVLPEAASANGAAAEGDVGSAARKLAARGKLGDAIRLLTARIDATAGRRGRFVLRLDLTRLFLEAARVDLAVPQLEQLEKEIAHFSLEEWEPDLATEVVRLLWQCCAGGKPPAALAARSQDIYARLCRLDPAAAVTGAGPQGV